MKIEKIAVSVNTRPVSVGFNCPHCEEDIEIDYKDFEAMAGDYCDTCVQGYDINSLRCIGCYKYDNYEPKEAEKVEEVDKTYTTGQMIDMLLDNPKRKAFTEDRGGIENTVIVSKNEILVWEHNKNQYLPKPFYKDRRWTIIEPEPEQVDFVEAFKAYAIGKYIKSNSGIKYSLPNFDASAITDATIDEIDNKWIILD